MKKTVLYLILSLFLSSCGFYGIYVTDPIEFARKKGRDCCSTKNSLCKTAQGLSGIGFCECNSAIFCPLYISGDSKMDELFKNKE